MLQQGAADPRVQAIRCLACHRLRPYPKKDEPRTLYCGCGCISFASTFPHDDELQVAIRLYSRELEENNTYSLMSQEIIRDLSTRS